MPEHGKQMVEYPIDIGNMGRDTSLQRRAPPLYIMQAISTGNPLTVQRKVIRGGQSYPRSLELRMLNS